MKVKSPVKYQVIYMIYENEGISDEEILIKLKKMYPLDRQINKKALENIFLSLKVVGIIDIAKIEVHLKDTLRTSYKITSYGESRIKFM